MSHYICFDLGAIFQKTGRLCEAVNANTKAAALAINDAESHNNLAVSFQEIGRLEEAEICCIMSISLDPEFAEPHYNLGIVHHPK